MKLGKISMLGVIVLTTAMAATIAFAVTREEKFSGSVSAKGEKSIDLHRLSKISAVKALEAAATHSGGSAISVNLENEDGYLVYAVETVGGKSEYSEVLVDAGDGKILRSTDKVHKKSKNSDQEEDDEDENDD